MLPDEAERAASAPADGYLDLLGEDLPSTGRPRT